MSCHISNIDILAARMIESALSHPHCFDSPTVIQMYWSVGNLIYNGSVIEVSYSGYINFDVEDGKIFFIAECVMREDEKGETLSPMQINLRTRGDIQFTVVGSSRLHEVNGHMVCVTET